MTRLTDLSGGGPDGPSPLNVLVAGGAGFIGSHLCDLLLSRGHRVICVDSLCTGRLVNIRPLTGHPAFTFLRHDIVEPLTPAAPVERIYNLACPAAPAHYQRAPVDTIRTCVNGTLNLLDLARDAGALLLLASAGDIYGEPEIHPQTERYCGNVDPAGPRACYNEGKRCAEAACFDYSRQFGVKIKVARIFNTYGPRMPEDTGGVVSAFIIQALRGAPLTLYGDGRQSRSFCHVADIARGLELLMESADVVTGPVNLGHPHEIPIRRLAERIIEQTGSRAGVEYRPLPADDPRRRRPDIARARNVLGWRPEVDLDEGLRATINDFLLRGAHLARDLRARLAAPRRPGDEAPHVPLPAKTRARAAPPSRPS